MRQELVIMPFLGMAGISTPLVLDARKSGALEQE